jgi:hypothetical protein
MGEPSTPEAPESRPLPAVPRGSWSSGIELRTNRIESNFGPIRIRFVICELCTNYICSEFVASSIRFAISENILLVSEKAYKKGKLNLLSLTDL